MGIQKLSTSNILFSKAQQRVLGLLYTHPNNDFYTNEIIRLIKSGTGATQRELSKLTHAGFIIVKKMGNQKRYQANKAMPFFFELRSIILKTFGLADILKKTLDPLRNKIKIAFIYGSIAKQEDNSASDIDLMVITDKLTYAELFAHLAKAEKVLNRKINPTFYTPAEWSKKQKEKNNFVLQILKQPKIFLIGTENEFREFSENRSVES